MTTKLVLRVLDASGRMLGGVVHDAQVPGDGTLRASGPVVVPVTADGDTFQLSTHWCDPHVETVVPMPANYVRVGDTVTVAAKGDTLILVGEPPRRALEPLVVGQNVVAVPTGGLGSRG